MECKQRTTRTRALFSALGLFKTDSYWVAQETIAQQAGQLEVASVNHQVEAERARALGTVYYYTIHDTRAR